MTQVRKRRVRTATGAVAALALSAAVAAPAVAETFNPPRIGITTVVSGDGVDITAPAGLNANEQVTVQVVRGAYLIAASRATADAAGNLLVNHAPATGPTVCWQDHLLRPGFQGIVPDIMAGDLVRVVRADGNIDEMTVADVGVDAAPADVAGEVKVSGFAKTPDGLPLAPASGAGLEATILPSEPFTNFPGGPGAQPRQLVAPDLTPLVGGFLTMSGVNWTATWPTVNDAADRQRAVNGTASITWTGVTTGTDATTVEFGPDVIGGPDLTCPQAPGGRPFPPDLVASSDTGASATDDITTDTTPTFAGPTGRGAAGTPVRIKVDGQVVAIGAADAQKNYFLTTGVLADGRHEVVMEEFINNLWQGGGPLAVTIDSTAPAAPALAMSPVGPADDNSPRVIGTAEAGSTVQLFIGPGCSAPAVRTGSAGDLAAGFPVSVLDNTASVYSATATDALGNVSACSAPVTYTERTAPPRGVASVVKGSLVVNRRWQARITLACRGPKGSLCFGRLNLVSRVDSKELSAKALRSVTVGSKAFAIRAGKRSSVLVTVNPKVRGLLGRKGQLAARVNITTRVGSGVVTVGRRSVTLVAPVR